VGTSSLGPAWPLVAEPGVAVAPYAAEVGLPYAAEPALPYAAEAAEPHAVGVALPHAAEAAVEAQQRHAVAEPHAPVAVA